ncbi:WXG100 family type VII secretion target [Nonomuraea sp. NPDC002799]
MSTVGASPAQLIKAAGHCQQTAQYIEGMRQRVEAINSGLVNQGWKGDAAQAFGRALTSWDGEFKKVIALLEQMYDKMNMNAGVYRNAADQDMDLMGSLTSAGEAGRIDNLINLPR